MPRVTVLMSVFNGSRYLREAMDSILAQTFTGFELLLVDDASTDDSVSIIESYGDPRIRLVRNETNLGLTKSLNRGLREARGELVARHDADDRSHPRRLEKQVAFLDAHRDVVVVGTQARTIDYRGRELRTNIRKSTTPLGIAWLSLFANPFIHSSVMFRRAEIAALGGYDEEFVFNQDFELWSRVLGRHAVANLPDALVDYRAHGESIAGRRDAAVLQSRVENAARNARVQRRNVLRETGSETLANEWPQLWTAINVPWFTAELVEPRRAIDYVDRLWEHFRLVHPEAVFDAEARSARAFALVTIALYLSQRDRFAALRALLRAWRADGAMIRPVLARWILLFFSTPRLVAAAQSVRRKVHA